MPGRKGFLYRRCPDCQVVRPASAFRRAGGPTFANSGALRRKCPGCGHTAPLVGFTIVERPEAPRDR
jgi:ribosomal protein S27E